VSRILWEKHPEKDAALKRMIANPRATWDEIEVAVGESASACRQRARRQRYEGWDRLRPGQRGHVAPVITSPQIPSVPVDQLWERIETVTDVDVKRHEAERLVNVAIEDDRPIGVTFVSDQHIRQSGPIMVRQMREDAELIERTDGLYAVLGGDGVDNHIKHREAMAAGGDKPAQSWRMYNHYLGMFGDKILAMISGNHDDWTRDFTGVDRVRDLAERNKVHYCPDEALIRLALPGQQYQLKVRHQFGSGKSRLNLTMAVKRLWELGDDDFDVGVLCHDHEAACEPFIKHGVRRLALRPGSYQLGSTYSRRYGFPHSYPTCPTAILWPNRRQLVGFWDVWEAASYLTWLRTEWPASDIRRPELAA
jgi:hypothetical protein